jgi:hypothetical protein
MLSKSRDSERAKGRTVAILAVVPWIYPVKELEGFLIIACHPSEAAHLLHTLPPRPSHAGIHLDSSFHCRLVDCTAHRKTDLRAQDNISSNSHK